MKKILVIITQANMMHLNTHETISAVMVLATFGFDVQVLLKDAGLSLLQTEMLFQAESSPFKIASHLVESFEFYDLLPILIDEQDQHHDFVKNSQLEIQFISWNADFIQQYQQVLYW